MAWERNVTQVSKEGIEIDVPITMSLDPEYGGGYVTPLKWTGRIYNIGIENLCCISDFDAANPKDENHRWQAITFNHIQDGWVRRVTAKHFAGSAVMLLEGSSQITVEDCKFLEPVSEIANHRRYAFHTLGQQTLFQRCYSETAIVISVSEKVCRDPMPLYNVIQNVLTVSAGLPEDFRTVF